MMPIVGASLIWRSEVGGWRLESEVLQHTLVLLADVARRDRWIVLEKDYVLAVDRFTQERSLEGERLHWIQIVCHDPRQIDVRGRRNQIRRKHRRLSARLEIDDVMPACVTACAAHPDARHDLFLLVPQLEH